MKRIIAIILICALTLLSLAGCSQGENNADSDSGEANTVGEAAENPVCTLVVKDYGTITFELYPEIAPNTVANFISVASSGFYTGVVFHRVIENFMIQCGEPSDSSGGFDYTIKGEFSSNGFKNDLKHERGVVSMARTSDPDSACTQFFICQQTSSHLDGDYAAFGRVTSGMDVVDKIAAVATDVSDRPLKDIVIESVSVDVGNAKIAELSTISR